MKTYKVYLRNSDGDVYMRIFKAKSIYTCIYENNLACYDLISISEVDFL